MAWWSRWLLWCRSGGVQCSCRGCPSSGGRRAAGPAAGLRTGRWLSGPGLWRLSSRSARFPSPTTEHRYFTYRASPLNHPSLSNSLSLPIVICSSLYTLLLSTVRSATSRRYSLDFFELLRSAVASILRDRRAWQRRESFNATIIPKPVFSFCVNSTLFI